MSKTTDELQLDDIRDRYERVKEKMSQADRIWAECALFIAQYVVDRRREQVKK